MGRSAAPARAYRPLQPRLRAVRSGPARDGSAADRGGTIPQDAARHRYDASRSCPQASSAAFVVAASRTSFFSRSAARTSDNTVLTQASDRGIIEAEPVGKHLSGMLTEQWRRFDDSRDTVETHRPGRHHHLALAMRHRLQDAPLAKARLIEQIHRVEHGAGRDADRAQLRHRLVLGALSRPAGHQLVDLDLAL